MVMPDSSSISRHIDVLNEILAAPFYVISCTRMTPRGSFGFALKKNIQGFGFLLEVWRGREHINKKCLVS